MVIPILFTSSYIVIGYHGQSQYFLIFMIYTIGNWLRVFPRVILSVISHDVQGNETERFIVATLLEKGR